MWRKTFSFLAAAILFAIPSFAQDGEYGAYSPYSIFGIGNIGQGMSAYNASMGGVGIASRNNRYLNTMNPAAVSVRDSLSLMVDFSVYNTNTIFSQTYDGVSRKSANNTTNIGGFAISFPIWNKLAGYAGLKPFSSVGYTFKNNQINNGKVITYTHSGIGSLYDIYGGVSFRPWKQFSVGLEADYVFGKIEKKDIQNFAATGYNEAKNYYTFTLNSFFGKMGVQYEHSFGKDLKLGVGATYSLRSNLHGWAERDFYSSGSVQDMPLSGTQIDTLKGASGLRLGDELGVGISINYANKFRAEFDYLRSDWRNTGMDSFKGLAVSDAAQPFASSVKESFRLGLEFVPNISDVRYYHKRIAYRAGAYYNNEYYTVAGKPVNSVGITLGVTLPVFRWYNGLTVSMDIGQRGPFNGDLVRENYFKFTFGVNLFDIWFQQPRYN